jgi:phenylalanyl-tRNA synthetase beta chain
VKVKIPYWRSDINIEDDLIEEVARIIGYDNIPVLSLSSPIPHHEPQQALRFSERLKDAFVKAGMQEVITYPLVTFNEARSNKAKQPLKILNPMNQNQEYLRTTLVPSLLSTIHRNRNTFDGPIRIFEIGSSFIPNGDSLPDERKEVAGIVSGPQLPTSWLGQTSDLNFYDVKGIVEYALRSLAIYPTFRPAPNSTKQAEIFVGSVHVGHLGEIDTTPLNNIDTPDRPVSVFSLDLKNLLSAREEFVKFKPIIKFPVAIRDVSLLSDKTTLSSDVEDLLQQHPLVDSTKLINVYLGKEIPPGKKSLAYRIHFRSVSTTLSELQVSKAFEEIVEAIQKKLGVTLRT